MPGAVSVEAAAAAAMSEKSEAVRVMVRCRPLDSTEISEGRQSIVTCHKDGSIELDGPSRQRFTFDHAFGPTTKQHEIYDAVGADLVESVCAGYNATIFAYGQTGSGKTFTMEGSSADKGLIPRCFEGVFKKMAAAPKDVKTVVQCSYLEVFMEEIRDLLSKDCLAKLDLKESQGSGVYVEGLNHLHVTNIAQIDRLMKVGMKHRAVGATGMNKFSSRSHAVFTLIVEVGEFEGGEMKLRQGKLNLVDLAGSERQSKTKAEGDRLKEAIKINQSLAALGNVISALASGGKGGHIPYRDSQLTRLLQDSLGGNTKTVMCANCGPADYNFDETGSTLRYANRAKNIKNKPRINEDPKDAMLRDLSDQIAALKARLQGEPRTVDGDGEPRTGDGETREDIVPANLMSEAEVKELEETIRKDAMEKMKKIDAKTDAYLQEVEEEKAEIKQKEEEIEEMKRRAAKAARKKRELDAKGAKLRAALADADQQAAALKDLESAISKAAEAEGIVKRQQKLTQDEIDDQKRELDEIDGKVVNIQQEVDMKTFKLRKLHGKYQDRRKEIDALAVDFQVEREKMLDAIRDLTRVAKLKQFLIDNFVPADDADRVKSRAVWDDSKSKYVLNRIDLRPAFPRDEDVRGEGKGGCDVEDAPGALEAKPRTQSSSRRPETTFARKAAEHPQQDDPRYRAEDIVNLDLDMPSATTQDYYEGAAVPQRVQSALTEALDGGAEDVEIEAARDNLVPIAKSSSSSRSSSRSGSSSSRRGKSRGAY